MAATKHSRGDTEDASRPSKKTRIAKDADSAAEAARLKQEKKDRKREKKKRLAEEAAGDVVPEEKQSGVADAANADSDAERAAAKALRKAEKRAKKEKKKLREAEAESEEIAQDDAAAAPSEKKKHKKKKVKSEALDENDDAANDENAAVPTSSGAYSQTMSLSNVLQSDIDAFLSEHEITVTDPRSSAPTLRPVTEFHHLPSTNLLEKKPSPWATYKAPTPIQAASWPFTLSGRDAVGVAETGSGKTMAFALPCVEAVSAIGKKGVKAIIVSPTRELAMQTQEQLSKLAALVGLKSVCIYGGASKDDQRALISRGADIIVATPGRLKDFMSEEVIDLSGAKFVVLDEADRMLDKGFEEDIKMILGSCPSREKRQTLMFTATWPQSVQSLASTFMVDPVKITIGGGKDTANGVVELEANKRITQKVEVVEPRDKEFRLLQILKQHQQGKQRNDRIIVFCLYKKEATRVEAFLSRKGVKVGGIHGDLKQEHRTRSLEAFKSGQTSVLVATDVAARGLDIPEVKLVINVTFPLTIEDYVHRIGRTGRAGKTGEAITLFTAQDKAHSGTLINILKGANQPVPDELFKFGTTVKKKQHDMYGSFFKDVDMNQKSTKITFD